MAPFSFKKDFPYVYHKYLKKYNRAYAHGVSLEDELKKCKKELDDIKLEWTIEKVIARETNAAAREVHSKPMKTERRRRQS